ncbi:MAG: PilX N-terminal domain-containing pilus assembly protein [Lysobacteraceae bacterium]
MECLTSIKHARVARLPAQRGSVLLVSLMILLVLTMITLVAMRGTTLQERIASSTRSEDFSLQMAEAVLRGVEDQIGDGSFVTPDGSGDGSLFEDGGQVTWYVFDPTFYGTARAEAPLPTSPDPASLPDSTYSINPDDFPGYTERNAIAPRYFVEALPVPPTPAGDSLDVSAAVDGITFYRITAVGYSGPSPDGAKAPPFSVILQSTFKKH